VIVSFCFVLHALEVLALIRQCKAADYENIGFIYDTPACVSKFRVSRNCTRRPARKCGNVGASVDRDREGALVF